MELENAEMPTRKQEPWRFTNLDGLWSHQPEASHPPTVAAPAASVDAIAASLGPYLLPEAAATLVLVDGVYDAALSAAAATLSGLAEGPSEGLFAGSVLAADAPAEALDALSHLPERDLPNLRNAQGSLPFTALNKACLMDAAVVWAAAGCVPAGPIQILHLTPGIEAGSGASAEPKPCPISHPRLLISAAEGAELSILQTFIGTPGAEPSEGEQGGRYFCNAVGRVLIAEGATVDHVLVQEDSSAATHVSGLTVQVAEEARYEGVIISLGGAVARVNVQIQLEGPTSHATADGLQLAGERQQLDLRSSLAHIAAETTAQQRVRMVAGGRGECVFKGRIEVGPDAENTDSQQICRSLLLSDKASVNVMPSLAIINPNVKCSHGATVADLDPNQQFYLESRGLDPARARELLIDAFVAEIAHRPLVNAALRRRIGAKLAVIGDRTQGSFRMSSI